MAIYMLVDGGVISNTIVADSAFAASIAAQHQAVNLRVGSEGIGDSLTSGIYLSQLANQSVATGDPVTFSVRANSAIGTLAYQWKKGGVDIGGATNASYAIATATSGDAGAYTCACSNGSASATTNAATLTVS